MLARVGPPVAWMVVIAVLSGDRLAASETGSRLLPLLAFLVPGAGPPVLHGLHGLLRKLGHLVEYGILAALWLRALSPGRSAPRAAWGAIGLAAGYAVLDEARQSLAPERSASVLDVAVDAAGALLAVACLQAPNGLAPLGVRLLRWAATLVALGSLGTALIDWRLGLGAWDLVLAALGATAVAGGLYRVEHRWQATLADGAPPGPGDSPLPRSGV